MTPLVDLNPSPASAGLHVRVGSGNLGGPERGLLDLGFGWAAHGRRISLAILDDGRTDWLRLRALFAGGPVELFAVKTASRFDPSSVLNLARLARDLDAPLLHAHDYKSDVVTALAAPLARRPWFTTLHGVYAGDVLPPSYVRLDRWAVRRARGRFAIGPGLLSNSAGADAVLVANPVRVPSVLPRAQIARPRRLVAVGRLVPQKGFDVLLAAMARARAGEVALDLTLVGDGPDRQALEAQAEALGLADHVTFAGWVADVTALLDEAELLVMPSRWESQGRAMLEAMARGVPVLAADTGTASELLADEVAGQLLPELSVDALESALRRAAGRTFDCRTIAERVRVRHSPEVVAGALLSSYRTAGVDLP